MKQITISQALEGYILFAEPKLSPHTLQEYFNTFRKFQVFLGEDILINDINVEHIAGFISQYQHLKKKTLRNYHTGLSALWTWAYQQKLVDEKVPQQYTPPKPDELAIVPYSEADIKAMLASCQKRKTYILPGQRETATDFPEGDRLKASLLLLLDTGIRVSEYCSLKFKDVDIRNRNIMVMGKGRKERQIPISSRTAQTLWAYFSTRPDMLINSPAFATIHGTHINRDNFLKSIYRLGERSGVQDPTIHRFRHTFAINYLRNGGDVYTLQRILGHSTLDMVKRYLSIAQVDIQAAHRLASPVMNWRL